MTIGGCFDIAETKERAKFDVAPNKNAVRFKTEEFLAKYS